jgi:hypothetical protein
MVRAECSTYSDGTGGTTPGQGGSDLRLCRGTPWCGVGTVECGTVGTFLNSLVQDNNRFTVVLLSLVLGREYSARGGF